MSPASSSRRGVYVERPGNDLYTALLVVALIAIAIACLMLVLEWGTYGFKTKPRSAAQAAVSPADSSQSFGSLWNNATPAPAARRSIAAPETELRPSAGAPATKSAVASIVESAKVCPA